MKAISSSMWYVVTSLIAALAIVLAFTGIFGAYTWHWAVAVGLLLLFFCFMFVLHRQQKALETMYERERDFVALVSHQLRIPLTELSWMIESVFESSTDTTPEQSETVQEIRGIIRGSTRLINDLLNISKIERGVLQLNCEETSVTELVRETVKILERKAKEREIGLIIDVQEKTTVTIDRQKTVEALRNIIDNALTYSPGRTTVAIKARASNGDVVITVKDSGPGIPQELQPTLFDKATAFTKKGAKEGAGLGLYLTKQFVEMMGGSVRFETSSNGTTFFVSLPRDGTAKCELPA